MPISPFASVKRTLAIIALIVGIPAAVTTTINNVSPPETSVTVNITQDTAPSTGLHAGLWGEAVSLIGM